MPVVQMNLSTPHHNEAIYADTSFILSLVGFSNAAVQAECSAFAVKVAQQNATIVMSNLNDIEIMIAMQRKSCDNIISSLQGRTSIKEQRRLNPSVLLPGYDPNTNGINAIYQAISLNPNFVRFDTPITQSLIQCAAQYQLQYSIDYGDAMHHAIADLIGVDSFVSVDQDFLVFSGNTTIYVDNSTYNKYVPQVTASCIVPQTIIANPNTP